MRFKGWWTSFEWNRDEKVINGGLTTEAVKKYNLYIYTSLKSWTVLHGCITSDIEKNDAKSMVKEVTVLMPLCDLNAWWDTGPYYQCEPF